MTNTRPLTVLTTALLIPLGALAVAACGGSGSAAAPTTASGASATVGLATTSLGSTLVSSKGRTLYLFKADHGTRSACAGACASAWPPLLATGNPTAGTGLNASKLATTTRVGGREQVTYNGHPLYLYVGDTKAGQVTGQGVTAFGAAWFAVASSGNPLSSSRRTNPGSSSSYGGSGY
jgi:predicted lipoprotein with Yx(FWY)xxD motif